MSNLARSAILVLACLLGGCHAPSSRQSAGEAETAILLAVLSHMVIGEDETGELVRFVELPPAQIEQLRDLCGKRFEIAPSTESEFTEGRLHLKNTSKTGVLIRAGVNRIRGRKAEASASYDHGPKNGWVVFDYRLRKEHGNWVVSSFRCRVAS